MSFICFCLCESVPIPLVKTSTDVDRTPDFGSIKGSPLSSRKYKGRGSDDVLAGRTKDVHRVVKGRTKNLHMGLKWVVISRPNTTLYV